MLSSWVVVLTCFPAYVCHRMSSAAALPLCPDFLVGHDWRPCSAVGQSCWLAFLSMWGYRMNSIPVMAIGWGCKQDRTTKLIPWPVEAIWWGPCLGTTSTRNMVFQYLHTGCCKTHPPFPSLSNPWWSGHTQWSPWSKTQVVLPGSIPQCCDTICPPWALFYPLEKHKVKEILLVLCCASLGEDQWGQSKTTLLNLIIWYFSVSVAHRGTAI